MKIVIVSGGFDPIHSGHIAYFKSAKQLGEMLIVALNSDEWLINKKGKFFMPYEERKSVIDNLSCVDLVIDFDDDDIGSATNALIKLKDMYPNDDLVFANGGDRGEENISEMSIDGVEYVFGVGGDEKKNSSSWILKKWQYDYEERVWGALYNLFKDDNVKVKELIIEPGKGMSFQRHFKRNEIWLVSKGSCVINFSKKDSNNKKIKQLDLFERFVVAKEDWHQITNPFDKECRIIEIQYGEQCTEEDIERKYYYPFNEI
tara:strand:- start:265 stop:1044 length:780 start_codon:yes stop_codon:yes gene_type:complete